MVDIDPYAQLSATQRTPRATNIVDQIAETKRVADAIVRSNPLYNARVDGGLMVWRGNYAPGTGSLADSFLWIGEFFPRDAVMNKAQRGFFLTRDDPKHGMAIQMWDPQAETRSAGNPLRQRLFMQDADGRQIMTEATGGGLLFPSGPIPLIGTAVNYQLVRTDSGTGTKTMPIVPAYCVKGTGVVTYYEGYGAMTGHRLRVLGFGNSSGGVFQYRVRVEWGDGSADYTSAYIQCAAGGSQTFYWDIDFAGQNKVGLMPHIRIEGQMVSGSDEWCVGFFPMAYSYGSG